MKGEDTQKQVLDTLSPTKILIPVAFGLAAAVYLLASEVDIPELLQNLQNATGIWFVAALLVLLIRDAGYIYRIRELSDQELSWRSSLYIIILWEFASAVTPSVVGGTAVAVFILNREGIKLGRSLALVMLTAFLDNMFFIIFSLLMLLITGGKAFPVLALDQSWGFIKDYGLQGTFALSYILITVYTSFFAYGLFFHPRGFKWLLVKATSLRWTRRWRRSALQTGNDMMIASQSLKGKRRSYWWKAILSTVFIWSARYLILNCLAMAFVDLTWADNILVFARQVIMWVVMLVSPTPGSSGIAESVFPLFYSDFFTRSFSSVVGIFWRLFYYYPYLFLGAIFLPRWLRRVYRRKID
ncbi:MAG: YbhN family protein [Bernardetiaceae bacterium]